MDLKKAGEKKIKVEVVYAEEGEGELADYLAELMERQIESLLVELERSRKE